MDLKQLQQFVAVAEELHFGKAAIRLGMTQPPLSQAIQRLETSLAAHLLHRTRHKVTLTAAGAALLSEARGLLAQAALAENLVRRVASGEVGTLRIGFLPMSAQDILPAAIQEFRRRWPGIEVHLFERSSRQTDEGLRDGTLDLGIVMRGLVDTAGLETLTIERTRMLVAVPSKWPIARRASLKLAELAPYPFVMFPQQLQRHFQDTFETACKQAGFVPQVMQQAAQPYTMMNLVAHELGVGVVQASARGLPIEGITFVDVDDMPDSTTTEAALAWVPRHVSGTHRSMIEIIKRRCRQDDA